FAGANRSAAHRRLPHLGVGAGRAAHGVGLRNPAKKLDAGELRLPESWRNLREAQATIIRYEGARSLADEYRRFADSLDPALRRRCEEGYATDARKCQDALSYPARCRAALSDAFGDCDVLIAPAATGEAPEGLGSTGNVAMNVVWTLLHVPCVSVPM